MSERKKLKVVDSVTVPMRPRGVPDPEVRAVAKRRQFSAAYKLAVLQEAERASDQGAIGALLRREGLYSSHLTPWRREREAGALEALGRRRGRKAKLTAEQKRVAVLEAQNARLERELEQARTLIEVQKNSAATKIPNPPALPQIVGINLPKTNPDAENTHDLTKSTPELLTNFSNQVSQSH